MTISYNFITVHRRSEIVAGSFAGHIAIPTTGEGAGSFHPYADGIFLHISQFTAEGDAAAVKINARSGAGDSGCTAEFEGACAMVEIVDAVVVTVGAGRLDGAAAHGKGAAVVDA